MYIHIRRQMPGYSKHNNIFEDYTALQMQITDSDTPEEWRTSGWTRWRGWLLGALIEEPLEKPNNYIIACRRKHLCEGRTLCRYSRVLSLQRASTQVDALLLETILSHQSLRMQRPLNEPLKSMSKKWVHYHLISEPQNGTFTNMFFENISVRNL